VKSYRDLSRRRTNISAGPSLEDSLPPLNQEPAKVAGRSALSFRDAHWSGRWIVFGLLFLLGWRGVGLIDRQWLSLFPAPLKFAISMLVPLIFLMIFPLVSQSSAEGTAQNNRLRTKWLIELLIAIPILLGIYFMFVVLNALITQLSPSTSLTPDVVKGMTYSSYSPFVIVWLLLSFTIGPVAEEIYFRGFLYNAFRARMPALIAGLLQSLIFAVCHTYSPVQIGIVFLMGLILTAVYEWRKTLVTPILVHIGVNLISAVMVLLMMWLHENRPVMGVICEPNANNCVICEIAPNSAAEAAGLKVGDQITTFNGRPIRNFEELIEWIRLYRVGDAIPVKIIRQGVEIEITVVLQEKGDP
jgi:membrane protease YdiL (CAAX protease family)